MLLHAPLQLLVAQDLVEHGLLDAMVAGISNARNRLELYIGPGNTVYVLIGAAVVLALFLFRRRR